jgi:hypothetical protein
LRPGDPLQISKRGERWCLLDREGVAVGRFALGFAPPAPEPVGCQVAAILRRCLDDQEPDFRKHIVCSTWEAVLPESVWAETSEA